MKFNENKKLLPPYIRAKIKNQIIKFALAILLINIVPILIFIAQGNIHDLESFVAFFVAGAIMILILSIFYFIILVALASRKDRDKYL